MPIREKKRTKKDHDSIQEDQSVRINRYLANSGISSRRKAEEYIKSGSVKVNGKVVTDLATKIFPGDKVTVNGDPISSVLKFTYILLNKPKNCITTTDDELGRLTVMDIVKKQERLFPVGRLDRNTTGVLLMTNDGELAYRLTHPKYQIERVYDVGLDKRLSVAHAKQIADGVELEDGFTGPCEVFMDLKDNTKAAIILHEGKNREVRRIFEHLNYEVRKLERKEFAGLNVKGLTRGEYRHLTRQELLALRALVKLK